MDDINRRFRQQEWEKLEQDVEEEYEKIKKEMSIIQIEAEPNDVEITSTKRGFWEHEIFNLSPFDVVCRVRATNSNLFSVNKNAFHIKSNEMFLLKISRSPYQIRSHHLKIDVTKFTELFKPLDFLDYFVGPYPFKTFIIRYHGAPRYWSDALEMNNWITEEQLNEQWETEMKKTSKEKKSSLETSEVSSMNEYQDAEEELVTLRPANMNLTNVMLMAMQAPDEVKKEAKESESDDDTDFTDTIESELANMKV